MRTYFQRIDFDKDGSITRKDFEGMAARFAEHSKLQGDAAKSLSDKVTAVWDKYLHSLGENGISQDAFIAGMEKQVKDPALKGTLEGPLPLFFQAVDSNNDGMISADEFGDFFRILGLDAGMGPASFAAIDTNNDGLLSQDEFVEAGSKFFISEDTAEPTRLFWGPLV